MELCAFLKAYFSREISHDEVTWSLEILWNWQVWADQKTLPAHLSTSAQCHSSPCFLTAGRDVAAWLLPLSAENSLLHTGLTCQDLPDTGKQGTESPSHSLSLLSLKTSNPGTRVTTVLLSSKTRGGLLFKMNIYAETGHVVNRLVNLQVTRQDLPNYLKQANKQTKKTSKNFNNKAISKIYFLETYN